MVGGLLIHTRDSKRMRDYRRDVASLDLMLLRSITTDAEHFDHRGVSTLLETYTIVHPGLIQTNANGFDAAVFVDL